MRLPPPRDPRLYQIVVLSTLLAYGVWGLGLAIESGLAITLLLTAQATQWLATRLVGLPRFDPRSALISGLSLCLLLRTSSYALAVLAAVLTIASKFLIRRHGKHVFNPTNFGLAAMLLLSDRVWVSPGQWGTAAFLGLLLACLGVVVVHRAARSDISFAFFTAYALLLFGRAAWLGDPLAIPFHQIGSGAFLIFTFFMISDPKTTPDSRAGRLLYATLVAGGAAYVQFGLFRPNGLIWALAVGALLVPLIDRLLPGQRYRWPSAETAIAPSTQTLPNAIPSLRPWAPGIEKGTMR